MAERRRGAEANGGAAPPDDPTSLAREVCLRLLTLRPRTRSELETALLRKGFDGGVVAEVLDRYADVGMIDDDAFARAWVTSRHHSRGLAKRALAGELRRKGVAPESSDAALEQVDCDTEEATARELVERRLRLERATAGRPSIDRDDSDDDADPTARHRSQAALVRRLVGLLARKGYSPGLAYRVVRESLAADASTAAAADLLGSDETST